MFDILIIGGGASGMMSAIASAMQNSSLSIAIVEKNDRVGKKILTTGNGRCNLTNLKIDISRYHGENSKFALTALKKADVNDTLELFKCFGIYPKAEGDKVFPNSLQASSVVDVLRIKLKQFGIREICNFNCVSIEKNNNCYLVISKSGEKLCAKRVIISTGGKASPKTGSDGSGYKLLKSFGHTVTKLYPSLVQLVCESKYLSSLKGVKFDGITSLYCDKTFIQSEEGEILFTDYGLSGPPVFQLSRNASVKCAEGKNVEIFLDLIPNASYDELYFHLLGRDKNVPIESFLTGLFNKNCARALLKECGVEKFNTDANVLSDKSIKRLAELAKNWCFKVTGTNSWDMAQVTAGGVKTNEFNPSTMESNFSSGLYACGEVLDIDGDCGGFNLQWAWSSAIVAGEACAKSIKCEE